MPGSEYREARPSDLESILLLCLELHSSTDNRMFGLSPSKMRASLLSFMGHSDMQFLVAVRGGIVVGIHAGVVYSDWFTEDLRADSFLIYVGLSARGGFVGKSLVKRFERWAFARGSKSVMLGFASGGSTDRMGGLVELLGYSHRGGVYKKET